MSEARAAGISQGVLRSCHWDVAFPVESYWESFVDPFGCFASSVLLRSFRSLRKTSTTKTRAFSPLRMTDKGRGGEVRHCARVKRLICLWNGSSRRRPLRRRMIFAQKQVILSGEGHGVAFGVEPTRVEMRSIERA